MGLHESQSRFYENLIGKSYSFWQLLYPKLQDNFKQLKKVSLNDFYTYINRTSKTPIRIDADELTYPLHIIIRYEIEKAIFTTNIKVSELPKLWNKLYKKYLGIKIESDSLGILQDIHWSGGSFGYFPSYALGSAYASQIYHYMNNDINVSECIKTSDFNKIKEWLKTHIHQFGSLKTTKEILLSINQEGFNPDYYINYLINKFNK